MPSQRESTRALRVIVVAAVLLSAAMRVGVAAAGSDSRSNRIDAIDAGVQAAEGVRAVKRLQHTFSHYLDAGLWNDLGDLFIDNAVGQFPDGMVSGRSALRKHFMDAAGRSSLGLADGQLNLHLVLQPIVTLAGDGRSAKGTWHEVAMLGQFGASASWRGGVYENEYVLDRGVWKISRLQFVQQYSGSYDDYGHKAPARWNIPYHFEAAHVGVTIPESARRPNGSLSSKGSAASRAAQLAYRVQRLGDETAVENLQHAYGYYMDRKLWDDVADLFADNGSLEVGQRGIYVGRARIRRALEVFYGAPPLRTGELFDHINLATVVTIAADGRTAGARTTELAMLGVNGEYARWEEGTYENEFVKDGAVWKLKAVHYYPRLASDYDQGWAKDAKPATRASADVPPDRPSAQTFESYPKTQYVGFHYANPVTGRPVQFAGAVAVVATVKTPRDAAAAPGSGADSDAALADLERRLDAAIAVDAVENLNSSYGYYIDESAWDQMADTFATTAGAKEITGAGVYVGRERIREVLNLRGPKGGRTPDFFTIHQLTQPVIHVSEDGNSAKARLRLFQMGGSADGSTGSWIGGIYENTAVKENGEWKFGIQDLHHLYNASYRNGWARVGAAARAAAAATPAAPAAPRPAAGREVRGGGIQQGLGGASSGGSVASRMPPDRTIRARQYAFPEIDEPAFHYTNPVSGRMPKDLLP